MAKIHVANPVVEMDGDEMTRIIWDFIKQPLVDGVNFISQSFATGINGIIDSFNDLGEYIRVTIDQIDFDPITVDAAKTFKVSEDEIYEAIASLSKKASDRIQVFYKDGSLHIAAD